MPLLAVRAFLSRMRHKQEARREFPKRERKERDAHIYAKEQREADALLAPAKLKGEAMEAALAAFEAETKPMLALKTAEELKAFATPLAASNAAERAGEAVVAALEAAKEAAVSQQRSLPAALKGAMLEAKRELVKTTGRAEVVRRKVKASSPKIPRCRRVRARDVVVSVSVSVRVAPACAPTRCTIVVVCLDHVEKSTWHLAIVLFWPRISHGAFVSCNTLSRSMR